MHTRARRLTYAACTGRPTSAVAFTLTPACTVNRSLGLENHVCEIHLLPAALAAAAAADPGDHAAGLALRRLHAALVAPGGASPWLRAILLHPCPSSPPLESPAVAHAVVGFPAAASLQAEAASGATVIAESQVATSSVTAAATTTTIEDVPVPLASAASNGSSVDRQGSVGRGGDTLGPQRESLPGCVAAMEPGQRRRMLDAAREVNTHENITLHA